MSVRLGEGSGGFEDRYEGEVSGHTLEMLIL